MLPISHVKKLRHREVWLPRLSRRKGQSQDLHIGVWTPDVLRGQHCIVRPADCRVMCLWGVNCWGPHMPSSGRGWHGSTFSSFIRMKLSTGNPEISGCFKAYSPHPSPSSPLLHGIRASYPRWEESSLFSLFKPRGARGAAETGL